MTEKAEQTEQKDTGAKFEICPCCGKPTLQMPVHPKDELMDYWLACMTTATPFTHTYPMYNGKVEITVVADSADMDSKLDTLTAILDAIAAREDLADQSQYDISHMKVMARIGMHITTIKTMTSKSESRVFTPAASVQEALNLLHPLRADIMSGKTIEGFTETMAAVNRLLLAPENMSAMHPSVLLSVVETHTQLNNILMNSGFDSNFWEGIELV